MELIGARLDGGIDDATLKIAELSRGVRSDQIEFLNGVGRGRDRQIVFRGLVVIHAVEDEVIRLLTVAVDRWTATVIGIVAAVEG